MAEGFDSQLLLNDATVNQGTIESENIQGSCQNVLQFFSSVAARCVFFLYVMFVMSSLIF